MKLLPSEIEVRYVIPTMRKELSKNLHKKGMSQKQISEILKITPSAISQYLKNKRANNEIPETLRVHISKSVRRILNSQIKDINEEIVTLLKASMNCGYTCYIHKKNDSVNKNCSICFKR